MNRSNMIQYSTKPGGIDFFRGKYGTLLQTFRSGEQNPWVFRTSFPLSPGIEAQETWR